MCAVFSKEFDNEATDYFDGLKRLNDKYGGIKNIELIDRNPRLKLSTS